MPGHDHPARANPDVSEELRRTLTHEGIASLVSVQPVRVQGRSAKDVALTVRTAAGEPRIED